MNNYFGTTIGFEQTIAPGQGGSAAEDGDVWDDSDDDSNPNWLGLLDGEGEFGDRNHGDTLNDDFETTTTRPNENQADSGCSRNLSFFQILLGLMLRVVCFVSI